MSECGLSHSWRMDQDDGIKVTCCVTHEMGHQECTSLKGAPDTSGSKNSIQAIGSTVKYLERYTLYAILGLASKEQDDDGNGVVEKISKKQADEIRDKLENNEIPLTNFLSWLAKDLKCDSIDDININALDIVNKRIDAAIRARQK